MAEASQPRSSKEIRVRVTIHLPSLDVELNSLTHPSGVDATLQSLLDATQSQANKIVGVAGLFGRATPTAKETVPANVATDPYSKMADDLGVSVEELKASKLIGFKESKPQILSAAKFASPEKGSLVLFYAFEIGLDRSPIPFEDAEEAFNMSRYTVAFASRVLTNLKNGDKINRSKYDDSHEIALTPSGVEDARDALRAAISGATKPRKPKKSRSK